MDDDQLHRVLRTLEDPHEPDPAFADALFNRLGMVARNERRSRTPFIVLAAAVLLVVLMAGAAIGSGLIELPFTANASPTPPASASAASGSPAPSTSEASSPAPSAPESPSPSPSPDLVGEAGELGVPEGLLPAGSVVIATADGLRIREEPTTAAVVVANVRANDPLFVVDSITAGPVMADGYDWYQVEYADGRDVWPWQDLSLASASGWVAAGNDTERFVRLAEVTCPAGPITLEALARLTSWERLVCLRDGPITIEGTFGCDACTESTPGISPAWLADIEQHPPIAGQYQYYPFIRVAISPGDPIPANRDIVRATLRLDDPASGTCSYVPEPEGTASTPDPMAVEVYCRERLVLDSFEVIGTDDFLGG